MHNQKTNLIKNYINIKLRLIAEIEILSFSNYLNCEIIDTACERFLKTFLFFLFYFILRK